MNPFRNLLQSLQVLRDRGFSNIEISLMLGGGLCIGIVMAIASRLQ